MAREDIVINKTCTRAPMDIDPTTGKIYKYLTNPKTYGLQVLDDVGAMSEVNWRNSECVVGSGGSR